MNRRIISVLTAGAVGFFSMIGAAQASDPSIVAAAAPPSTTPAAKPEKTFKLLTSRDLDPARALPPPVSDGSAEQIAELAEVQRIYKTRTPARYAQAQWDNDHEDVTIFSATLGPSFDLTKLPATAKLLALVDNEQSVAAGMAKKYFLRTRPWAIDKTIIPCDFKPGANPKTSYPSGHATLGYALGGVLAALMPDRAQAILARSREYAYSRLICGDHYASDTEASHALGVSIALLILRSPDVAAQIDAARTELRAAQLTKN